MVLGEEREALWRKVLVAKYGEEVGGLVSSRVSSFRVFSLRGTILKFGDVFFGWGCV